MRITVPLALLCVLPPLQAQNAPEQTARQVFERAVAAQGKVDPGGIGDLHVKFEGQVKQQDEKTQSAVREYWLRPKDGSFRIRTTAGADPSKPFSERGVLGSPKERFWESVKNRRTELRRTNREHRKNIQAIERDREEFKRIVHMVLLARLNDGDATISFGAPRTARIEHDQPNSARQILGTDRATEYHVIDVARPETDRLRFFIRSDDFTVRKVVQFDRLAPDEIKSVSYFGFYRKNPDAAGMLLPQAFSVYSAVPDGKDGNEATMQVSGRLTVAINGDLKDDVFAPDK